MKKKGILLAIVILLIASAFAQAQENKLGVTLDVTYASRYIWRGFDRYSNNDGAIRPSIDLDFYGTGFGFKVLYSTAVGGGHVDGDEVDFTIYYDNTFWGGETYATDYKVGWTCYSHPHRPRAAAQEFFGSFSWPNVFPLGIVPNYTVVKMWPSTGNPDVTNAYTGSGWFHILGLGYDWVVPELANQVLKLSADLVYNDGAGTASAAHEWSHMVFGVSTGFIITSNLTFTPAFYFQKSMESSVNGSDEYWTTLSLTYTF